jgi:hypothetical protein
MFLQTAGSPIFSVLSGSHRSNYVDDPTFESDRSLASDSLASCSANQWECLAKQEVARISENGGEQHTCQQTHWWSKFVSLSETLPC